VILSTNNRFKQQTHYFTERPIALQNTQWKTGSDENPLNPMAWHGIILYAIVWHGIVWYSIVWDGSAWLLFCGIGCDVMVWYNIMWYGMGWQIFMETVRKQPDLVV